MTKEETGHIPGTTPYVRHLQEIDVVRAQENPNDPYHTFFSLVKPHQKPKKRPCLKCRRMMLSAGTGNRICSHCKEIVLGALAMR